MTRLLFHGDHIAGVDEIVMDADASRPAALVWGLDLSDAGNTRQARRTFRDVAKDLARVAARTPDLEHVVLLYRRADEAAGRVCLGAAGRIGARLEADLERARGRRVTVVALDVTRCDDPARLCARVREHVARHSELDAAALDWDEIRDEPIRRAVLARSW